jgi:sugar lactone lactonase YvrE
MKNIWTLIIISATIIFGCEETAENPDLEIIVSTLAGGEQGYQDGLLEEAKFDSPTRLTVASDGSVYVVEKSRVRKIATDGVVSTVAGSTESGYVDDQGTDARFGALFGIAIDNSGNFFLTDAENFCIRKIDNQGNVTTYAGAGMEGYQDGPADIARFGNMGDLIVTEDGTLYVCDAHNLRIRKIDIDGNVTTIAGGGDISVSEGPALEVYVHGTMDLAMSQDGNVFFLDSWGHRISELSTDGMISVIAGDIQMNSGFADGMGLNARFINPMGIACSDDGLLVVADTWNNRIRLVKKDYEVVTIAGDGNYGYADGQGDEAMFNQPFDVAFAPDGAIYVADTYNHRVRKIEYE